MMADDASVVLASIIDTAPISNGGVSITPNFLEAERVNALRADANALYCSGAFVRGTLRRNNKNKHKKGGTTDATDERTRLCHVCGLFDDAEHADPSVGDRDARDHLLDVMAELREMLQTKLGVPLSDSMELQYLRYPGETSSGSNNRGGAPRHEKGFYGRHLDHTEEDDKTCRRNVSLLLYLNEDGWNAETDGGVLRAYIRHTEQSTHTGDHHDARSNSPVVQDVVPEGGTLVLFDSKSVEHEVLPTCKERWAVVGWFLSEEKQTEAAAIRVGGNKRSRHSGNEQVNYSKKKKKKKRKGR